MKLKHKEKVFLKLIQELLKDEYIQEKFDDKISECLAVVQPPSEKLIEQNTLKFLGFDPGQSEDLESSPMITISESADGNKVNRRMKRSNTAVTNHLNV